MITWKIHSTSVGAFFNTVNKYKVQNQKGNSRFFSLVWTPLEPYASPFLQIQRSVTNIWGQLHHLFEWHITLSLHHPKSKQGTAVSRPWQRPWLSSHSIFCTALCRSRKVWFLKWYSFKTIVERQSGNRGGIHPQTWKFHIGLFKVVQQVVRHELDACVGTTDSRKVVTGKQLWRIANPWRWASV